MVLWVLRALFLGLLGSLPFLALPADSPARQLATVGAILLLGVAILTAEYLTPRESLRALSGLFFGLIVGMLVALLFGLVIESVAQSFLPNRQDVRDDPRVTLLKIVTTVICCYVCIALVLKTKDDFRFVIPYVEFTKQTKGPRPMLLDTSIIIDGRIADVCETRIIDSPIIIPRFVLAELQAVADSSDKLKRNRGRRGLDVLNRLQGNDKLELRIHNPEPTPAQGEQTVEEDVDQKLVSLARQLNGRVVTNDYNLNKVAQFRGVEVININDLANALKPVVLPGETVLVKIIKAGEEPGQGVGYLEDGTMVVAASSREKIGLEISIEVTSVLQTSAGRMIFGRPEGSTGGDHSPREGPVATPSGKNRVRRPHSGGTGGSSSSSSGSSG